MTEIQNINRKILIKRQARRVMLEEIQELEFKLTLLQMKNILEAQMAKNFDPALSRKLDCISYLLEAKQNELYPKP